MRSGGSHGDIKAEIAQPDNATEENGNCRKKEEFDSVNCMSNCQDNTFGVEEATPNKVNGLVSGDSQTKILDRGHESIDDGMDTDSTEYSSSVEDFSDYEDGPENDSSSMRMESELDELPVIFDGWNRVSRKKKMTEHWRKYIQPLMWRCRWIELRVRELQSQVAKYNRELLGNCSNKSEELKWPPGQHAAWNEEAAGDGKMYRRKKRKKVEDMVDVQSYLSEHVIFSYFDNRPEADDLIVDEGFGNQAEQSTGSHDDIALSFEWPNLEIKGNDKFLERILLDIESAQVRVLALKSRLGKTISENISDIYTPGMFIPGDPNYRPSLSPRCSPVNNGCAAPLEATGTSPYICEFDNEELALSGSAISSYGDASHPDIIESTADLLASAMDRSCVPNQIGNMGADVADDILISNQAADEDLHDFENIHHPQMRPLGYGKAEEEGSASAHRISSSETETDPDIAPAVGRRPAIKRCGVAAEFRLRRSKRKRKLRKASPGGWNGEKMRRRNKTRKQGPS